MLAKKKLEIISKPFMLKKDLKTLTEGQLNIDVLFAEIRKNCIDELQQKGKIMPDKKYILTKTAMRYLKDYGISRESIINDIVTERRLDNAINTKTVETV